MSADMERRMNETAERIGTYDKKSPVGSGGKRNDLVSHVLRLQERVKEIQHIVKSVVPVFSGDDSISPSISPTPTPTKSTPLRLPKAMPAAVVSSKTAPKQLTVAIVGLDGVGALSAQLFAQAGVGKLVLIDSGSVEPWHVQHLMYSNKQLGKLRSEATNEILEACDVDISSYDVDAAVEGELAPLLQSVDLVIDSSSADARLVVAKICVEQQCTRIQCGVDGLVTYFQMHLPSTDVEELKWPPEEAEAAKAGLEWLVSATVQTCAGHMVQNALKHLLGAGSVTGTMQLNGLTNA